MSNRKKYHLGRLRLKDLCDVITLRFLHFVSLTSGLHAAGRLCTSQSGSHTSLEHWLTTHPTNPLYESPVAILFDDIQRLSLRIFFC